MYDYKVAHVIKVVDGDTVDLTLERTVDYGFYLVETKQFSLRFRLLGVDTPERGQPGFTEATNFVKEWLAALEGHVRARTYKADSFGRWLVDLYEAGYPEQTLSQALIDSGNAQPYVGR